MTIKNSITLEPGSAMKRTGYAVKDIEVVESERAIISRITTDAVDRDEDVIVTSGIALDQYRKNPVVLWAHDYRQPPIARNQWIKGGDGELIAKTEFAETDFADEIYGLYKAGFLNAWSIGGRGMQFRKATEADFAQREDWRGMSGLLFEKFELWEYSACPVPSNPNALDLQFSKYAVSETLQKVIRASAPVEVKEVEKQDEPETEPEKPELQKAKIIRPTMTEADIERIAKRIDLDAIVKRVIDRRCGRL